MKKFFLSVVMLNAIVVFMLSGCGSSSSFDDNATEVVDEAVIEEVVEETAIVAETTTAPKPIATEDGVVAEEISKAIPATPAVPTEKPAVPATPSTPIDEPVIEDEPTVSVCGSIGEVQEFIPFSHDFGEGQWLQDDYEAVASQPVIYVNDCVSYDGKIYKSLRNFNAYPDAFNTNGNPFRIITDQAFNGGVYTRIKPNESTCTEEITLSGLDDINDMNVWKVDWYTKTIHGTDNCKTPDLEYSEVGQLGTALYGISAYGWSFIINEVMYVKYGRDYTVIPTPASPEDLNFWELVK